MSLAGIHLYLGGRLVIPYFTDCLPPTGSIPGQPSGNKPRPIVGVCELTGFTPNKAMCGLKEGEHYNKLVMQLSEYCRRFGSKGQGVASEAGSVRDPAVSCGSGDVSYMGAAGGNTVNSTNGALGAGMSDTGAVGSRGGGEAALPLDGGKGLKRPAEAGPASLSAQHPPKAARPQAILIMVDGKPQYVQHTLRQPSPWDQAVERSRQPSPQLHAIPPLVSHTFTRHAAGVPSPVPTQATTWGELVLSIALCMHSSQHAPAVAAIVDAGCS